jgi:hypothetical protein
VKRIRFGKMKYCLWIKIERKKWEGKKMKRDDKIKFNELIVMDN